MSETTLTKDALAELRTRKPAFEEWVAEGDGPYERSLIVKLTTSERDALCDAAERAETLEAEVAKWNKCDSLVCPYEQRALQAEAQFAEVTRVVEERMMKLSNWIRTPFNINPDDAIDECAQLIANNAKTIALPADPSAPTPR